MNRSYSLLAVLGVIATTASAEWRVSTDFENGNAEVVHLDQAAGTLRIMPALHEGRGWPCWWSFKIEGLTTGEEITLEVQAQTRPYHRKTVLAGSWCQPNHAWISSDGMTWKASAKGARTADKVMIYKITAAAARMSLAWGPPFAPSDAEKLLAGIAEKLPEAKRFELAKTRGGRPVHGIRIGEESALRQVWVNARRHAWEAGSSQVGRGFIEWYAGDDAAARELRAETCLHFIPIMDVDNVAIGAGGKNAVPRDHNRDWAAEPFYPEVAAAQRMIRDIHAKRGLDVFIDLHNPGPDDPIFFFGPFGFEEMTGLQQRNYQRWIDLAAANIVEPLKVQPKYRFATYVQTDEERGRMSGGWVRANYREQAGNGRARWHHAPRRERSAARCGISRCPRRRVVLSLRTSR
ncbi:MAG: M14-type cytosolic carboxypeptidase [Verrucomicrobiota bacterium]|nr:M14-type cytosolic carboxypeptidase [Verrucomicrobiota bacterium]